MTCADVLQSVPSVIKVVQQALIHAAVHVALSAGPRDVLEVSVDEAHEVVKDMAAPLCNCLRKVREVIFPRLDLVEARGIVLEDVVDAPLEGFALQRPGRDMPISSIKSS